MPTHTRTERYLALALLACLASLSPGTARGDTPEQAWHRGVPEANKQRAQALFTQGGELLERLMLREARARYEAALSYWEHPQIRFYLGKVLHELRQPLDAYENLRQAVAWGPEALEPEEQAEAHRRMRALATELAAVAVRCDEPGARVELDGQPWFVSPGAERRLVMPGTHVITARKPGYFTVVENVTVVAGKQAALALALAPDTLVLRSRWPAWMPWAVVVGGMVTGVTSTSWRAEARIHLEQAERAQSACGAMMDCPAHARLLARARREERLADGARAAGAVLVAGGLILVWLNRPHPHHTEASDGAQQLEVVPLAVDGATGLSARFSF